MKQGIKAFNIRVYALIINTENKILVSDEFQLDMKMTKFPGGGVNLGEGIIEALHREFNEEFGQELIIDSHFYTTDFFQQALVYTNQQLVSIYYIAHFKKEIKFKISQKPFDFPKLENGQQSFRWIALSQINETDLTLPIDKKVVQLLKQINQHYSS